jgi:predicted unusual protein kinase regulating ubiquinone biosynthesis (AarF/ABC1/UbiB family)
MTATELFGDIWARYIRTLAPDVSRAPQTLLHGDPHIGNTYVLPDDTVGFLDWQMVRRDNCGGDSWQRPEICLALAQRYSAAFVDLDTRAALDSITT